MCPSIQSSVGCDSKQSSGAVNKIRRIWLIRRVGMENSDITFMRRLINNSRSDGWTVRSGIRLRLRFRTVTYSLVWPFTARPEVPLVDSSNGPPDGCAVCHALASAALSHALDGTTGLALLYESCLFPISWRPCVNEKQTTFKEEKTIWQINQHTHVV